MADESFDTWLGVKLKSLSIDEEVYLDYLRSVLTESEDSEETKTSLVDVLAGILEENVEETVDEIVIKWTLHSNVSGQSSQNEEENNLDKAEDKIKSIIELQQTKVIGKPKQPRDEELKKLVLEQYSAVAGNEDEESGDDGAKSSSTTSASEFVNMNAQSVIAKEQGQRDKMKKESEDKKQKDKFDREKDKQKREDRQDKEKKRTQKGERRAR